MSSPDTQFEKLNGLLSAFQDLLVEEFDAPADIKLPSGAVIRWMKFRVAGWSLVGAGGEREILKCTADLRVEVAENAELIWKTLTQAQDERFVRIVAANAALESFIEEKTG